MSNKSTGSASNSAADCELVNNVKVLDHLTTEEKKLKKEKETEMECCKLI